MQEKISKTIKITLLICIGIGILAHIVPYFYNRGLWIDEAFMASSICTRNLKNLIATPLDWGQSAPIGYLYMVKLLTIAFGTSKAVLRIVSLFFGLASIGVFYLLIKDKVKNNYALFFTAIYSLTDKYIYYSNEFKSYMFDNFLCLLVVYIYEKYCKGKLQLWKLIVAYTILIWFSFAAIFFIAACMVLICLSFFKKLIKEKDLKVIKKLVLCLTVLISFGLYYMLWLSQTSSNVADKKFWNLLRFPIIPKSTNDFKMIIVFLQQFFSFFNKRSL